MFVNIKIKHFMLIKYSKKSHKTKNSKRTFLINKKEHQLVLLSKYILTISQRKTRSISCPPIHKLYNIQNLFTTQCNYNTISTI